MSQTFGALLAVEQRLDRAVADAVDGHAVAQRVELRLRDPAMRAHAIAPQPAGRGQFERAREPAVIGEQQQPLGVEVEPADADQARQVLRQRAEDGRPPLRVGDAWSPARAACGRGTAACAPRRAAACRRPRSGRRASTLSAGEAIVAPLTATRPAAIQASASRREREPRARDHLGDALAFVSAFCAMSGLMPAVAFMDDALAEARCGAQARRRGAGRLRDRARRRGDRARRQPHAARPRSDRACRDAGDPRGRRARSAPSGSPTAIST